MPLLHTIRPCVLCAWLLIATGLLAVNPASAQEKPARPRISAALRAALEKDPLAAVEKRFLDALKSGRQEYVIDSKELSELGVEYIQKGDMDRGRVVLAIAAQAAESMMADLLPGATRAGAQNAERQERDPPPARIKEEDRVRQRTLARLGPGRDDLDRFHGLYGRPEVAGRRTVFLVRNCDGHLLLGAAWGDVAPWAMRSVGDTSFEHPGDDHNEPIHLEIITGADGKPTRIVHDLTFIASPLLRLGDLPANWTPDCTR